MDESSAPPKVTVTPGSSQKVRPTMAVLTKMEKKPSVKIISGKEMMVAIGLTVAFNKENKRPAAINSQLL